MPASLTAPVDVVVAVDESYSITKAEMKLEKQAAGMIALGEFARGSRIGVLGFGGDDRQYDARTNKQQPVNTVCPMTTVGTVASRRSLIACINGDGLHKRTAEEGDYTDFIDAISDGVALLAGTPHTGRPLLLFLLTDGKLDMLGTPHYPKGKQANQVKADQVLTASTLPLAKSRGVRIWPLGFGPDVDKRELREIAAGGAQGSCAMALPQARPQAVFAQNDAQVEGDVQEIFADAQCLGHALITSKPIPAGSWADLFVTVPEIVTAGSIVVFRQSRQVDVTYFDPENRRVPVPAGSLAGQVFSLAGTNGPVESLSIGSPLPGRWRIHAAAGQRASSAPVTVSVLWQGVLHSDIVTAPADPAAGQPVAVTVKLQLGSRPVSAVSLARAHVQVSVEVSGPGLAAPLSVPVNDDGIAPDVIAHDGLYNGRFAVPRSVTGTLTATSVVSAPGVTGDTRSASITVDSNGMLVTGQMTLPAGKVAQGGQVDGTVRFSNPAGKPHTIRLVPQDTPPGVTITPSVISLPAVKGPASYQFTMHVADSVPVGAVTGHINANDATTGSVYAQATIASTVVAPRQSQTSPWYWVFIALGAGLLALAIGVLIRTRGRLRY